MKKNILTILSLFLLVSSFSQQTNIEKAEQINEINEETQEVLEKAKKKSKSDALVYEFLRLYENARIAFNNKQHYKAKSILLKLKSYQLAYTDIKVNKTEKIIEKYYKKADRISEDYHTIYYKIIPSFKSSINYATLSTNWAHLKYKRVGIMVGYSLNFPSMWYEYDKEITIYDSQLEFGYTYLNWHRYGEIKNYGTGTSFLTVGVTKSIKYPLWGYATTGYSIGSTKIKIEEGSHDGLDDNNKPINPRKIEDDVYLVRNSRFHGPVAELGLILKVWKLSIGGGVFFNYDIISNEFLKPQYTASIGYVF